MIVATAGHVDHGKTSLVKQLTGVDTDRLEEEKRRGLSINLGYAYRRVDAGETIGFIDVPGHRRFINTMIAGVSGIDIGMLIVAADDGPMPQTREHLDVLQLLGVRRYLSVLTKIDRVDASRVAAVRAELAKLLPPGTPLFAVSNTAGSGVGELAAALDELAQGWQARAASGCFRLSIDRAFHLKGAGLVVTGTVASGSVRTGETLRLQPQQLDVRVRRIHAQDEAAEVGLAGQRCALNLAGPIDREAIDRGDWLTAPDAIPATSRFDARIQLLPAAAFALKQRVPVKLHLGAKRVSARLLLLGAPGDRTRLQPGDEALVQFAVEGEVVCCCGDRFLIRDDSESETLGGGEVIDPLAPRYGKSRPERLAFLEAMSGHDAAAVLQELVIAQQRLVDVERFRLRRNLRSDETAQLLEKIAHSGARRVTADGVELLVAEPVWRQLRESIVAGLTRWHAAQPGEAGIKPALLRQRITPGEWDALFIPALTELLGTDELVFSEGLLRLKGHRAGMTAAERAGWECVEQVLRQHATQIPAWSLLLQQTGFPEGELRRLVARAVREKRLHKLSEGRYALPDVLRAFARTAMDLAQQADEGFTVIEFRDRAGCGRNLAIEVLEYLDLQRITRRIDQRRKILDRQLLNELLCD